MPRVLTTVHYPVALVWVCELLDLPPPAERSLWLDTEEVFGWAVRLGGLRHPVVCDTLTGLVAYHRHDNAFDRYARLMAFIERYYDLRPKLRRGNHRPTVFKGRRVSRRETA